MGVYQTQRDNLRKKSNDTAPHQVQGTIEREQESTK